MRMLAFLALLIGLGAVVRSYPFLFEIFPLGAAGGAYWLFFRKPPDT